MVIKQRSLLLEIRKNCPRSKSYHTLFAWFSPVNLNLLPDLKACTIFTPLKISTSYLNALPPEILHGEDVDGLGLPLLAAAGHDHQLARRGRVHQQVVADLVLVVT